MKIIHFVAASVLLLFGTLAIPGCGSDENSVVTPAQPTPLTPEQEAEKQKENDERDAQ